MKKKEAKSSLYTKDLFEEFIRKEETLDFIKKMREILGLPKDGLELTKEHLKSIEEEIILDFYVPKVEFHITEKSLLEGENKGKSIQLGIINACNGFAHHKCFDSRYIKINLRMYVFFNRKFDIPVEMFDDENDLFKIEHIPTTLSEYDNEDHFLLKCLYDHFEFVSKKYPVALFINPEISQNQLKDFISKKWVHIKKYAKSEENRSFKIRTKKHRERDDFIFDNRNLPISKIREMLALKFKEYLDDGHIGKIISLEKRKRNKKLNDIS
ncbi:MAG: hypothetical protein QG583_24 [Patescibacteria group bacterium]|nr:hypothetical protein [Patescibacteria group bacterium]